MQCVNCGLALVPGAKFCSYCEAPVTEAPGAEATEAVREALEQMPPDVRADLHRLMQESESAEDFVNAILVGNCPKCGSTKTGDCDNDPEIENIILGRCYVCGQFWCTECGRLLDLSALFCPCWAEDPGEGGDEQADMDSATD